MRNTLVPRLLAAMISIAFCGSASAAGFQLIEQNASGIGNAYAGSAAVAENASTIFYNPAGMTQLQDREVSVGVAAINPSFKFTNANSIPTGNPTPLSGNGGDAGGMAFLPNAYMSWALSKDVYAGVGLGAPFGLKTEYDSTWLGATQAVKFDIKTYNINPSIAFRVNDQLSLGAGVSYMMMDAEYVRRTAAYAGNPLVTLKADNASWGWNIGALFKVSNDTKLGFSYRSGVKQKLDGSLTITGVTSFAAKADLTLPDTAILSMVHKLNDQWELLADLSWTGWSSIPKVDIIRKSDGATVQTLDTAFNDSMRVAVGANYRLSEQTKLKFGVAYDQTPVPDANHRLVSLPDNDRLWLSTGAQWKTGKGGTFDFGAAYLFVRDARISNDQRAAGRGLVDGTYSNSGWILGAQYSHAF